MSETLAGRIERFELWPFSQDELAGTPAGFLDRLVDGDVPETISTLTKRD